MIFYLNTHFLRFDFFSLPSIPASLYSVIVLLTKIKCAKKIQLKFFFFLVRYYFIKLVHKRVACLHFSQSIFMALPWLTLCCFTSPGQDS